MPYKIKDEQALRIAIHRMAIDINDALSSDSNFRLSHDDLLSVLVVDVDQNGGTVMSTEETDLFIMGDDEGEVPEELTKLFPRTHHLIGQNF